MDEFSIIREYFTRQIVRRDDVAIGVGDDGAVLVPQPDLDLVSTTDMLLEGIHFPATTEPYAIGYKALAVNLSDLAAMGAKPVWVTLALSLPAPNFAWIKAFAAGFLELAADYQVQLVGGDLCRGPLVVAVHAMGYVARNQAILRSGAEIGDAIFISGQLGDAGMALKVVQEHVSVSVEERTRVIRRLEFPQPRVDFGQAIVGVAHAAIDVSDGLYADLGHIVLSSNVAARVELDSIPVSDDYKKYATELGWETALCGGDDYELCFVAPLSQEQEIKSIAHRLGTPVTKIGRIEAGQGVHVLASDGVEFVPHYKGHDHFAI